MESRTFVAADYVIFALMLAISIAIGIFYAHRGRKQNQKTLGYLLANRSMTMIPVAISLSMSFQSSITMLAIPAEVYLYGTMILWVVVIYVVIAIITSEVFLPTFYRLGISSTYEYLELRFGKVARLCGTLVFVVASVFYCGIVIYGPALAFGAVTGFPTWLAIISTGLVCTLYTTVGGLEGVIWTDVFQGVVMIAGMLAFLIKGSLALGGFSNVWHVAESGGRIDFNHFETDVRIRNTFWSIVIGGVIRWTGMYGVSQSQVQRYLSCRSERQARLSIYLNIIGLVLLFTMGAMAGVIIYAFYKSCDPLMSGCVKRPDQIYPYMMLELFKDLPGASGLILSAVYAGSLSSVSSGVNAMATVTMQDVIKPIFKDRFSDSGYLWISKGVCVIFGLLCIGMSFLLSTTKELLQAAFSLMGMLMGSLTGFFTLAIQFPFANAIGSISGLSAGIASTIWFYFGRQTIKKSNLFIRQLPRSIDGCVATCNEQIDILNTTMASPSSMTSTWLDSLNSTTEAAAMGGNSDDDTPFYTLSYHYISAIGLSVTIAVGIIVSLATCGWKSRTEVDKRLLRPPFDHPMFRCWLPEKVRWYLRFGIEWEDNVAVATNNEKYAMDEEKIPEKSNGVDNQGFQPDKDANNARN